MTGPDRQIVLAMPDDVPAIERLVAAAYAPYVERIGKPPAPMLDDYRARVAAEAAWILKDETSIAGVIVLVPKPDHLLIDNVAVAPPRQGRGVGRALLAFAEREAERRGYADVRLYTNAHMHENLRLYAKLGYQETGRGEDAGYRRVYLHKRIA